MGDKDFRQSIAGQSKNLATCNNAVNVSEASKIKSGKGSLRMIDLWHVFTVCTGGHDYISQHLLDLVSCAHVHKLSDRLLMHCNTHCWDPVIFVWLFMSFLKCGQYQIPV